MRIRTIKPEFWTDSFMVELPAFARLLFVSLWSAADDHGCLPDEPGRLAMEVMPREDPLLVDDWLQFFVAADRLEILVAEDGETYLRLKNWERHQRVDRPSKSRLLREGSRKLAIPQAVRRAVAEKYGCLPGGEKEASCFHCGAPGRVHWHSLSNGRPSAWVTFPGLELDLLESEAEGGAAAPNNIVLACRHCNRSKGTRPWFDVLSAHAFARAREGSCTDQGSGIRDLDQEGGARAREAAAAAPPPPPPDPLAPESPGPTLRELQALWNERMPHPPFPRWKEIGEDQRKAAKRVRERPVEGPDGWLAVLERLAKSNFCRGDNDRAWVADPDFLLRQATPRKALQGNYDNREPGHAEPERRKRYG